MSTFLIDTNASLLLLEVQDVTRHLLPLIQFLDGEQMADEDWDPEKSRRTKQVSIAHDLLPIVLLPIT